MNKQRKRLSALAGMLAMLLLVSMLTGLRPTDAYALESSSEIKDQIEDLEEQQEELEEKMKALRGQISENLSEMERIAQEKNIIDQEIFLLNEQIVNINHQISAYSLLIADKQDELDAAKAHLADLSQKNKARIRAMEEDGELSYWSVLFKANSFSDLLDRLDMIEEIAAADQRRLKEMSAAAQQVEAARLELEAGKSALVDTKAELEQMQLTMESKRAEADMLLISLNAQGMEYKEMLDAAEADEEALQAEIAKKEKEYTEAKRQEYLQWLSTSVPPTTKPPSSSTSGNQKPDSNYVNGLTWYMPCRYSKFTSAYGWRIHPVYGTRKFHSGVDLAAPSGTPIYATRSGTVTATAYNSSSGYYVTINHGDGFSSSYLHMTNYIVSVGQRVTAGQVIGYVGSTGVSTGPHLHFTIYYNGSTVNPANYISFY